MTPLIISNLCVIGGDGSLTGANFFQNEWNDNLQSFINEKIYSEEYLQAHRNFQIVGLVGSIDNDFYGTDMTIGVDSAMWRITESLDNIQTTACSHKRVFILEVMGRNCGYLALMCALGSNAEYCFLPESPPPVNWQEKLVEKLKTAEIVFGKRAGIIILSEGAVDSQGKAITSGIVKDVLKDQFDVRATVLGHVQRGGNTSFYDRCLASRMGIKAIEIFKNHRQEDGKLAKVVISKGTLISAGDMMELVNQTKKGNEHLKNKEFDQAIQNRGTNYEKYWKLYQNINKISNYTLSDETENALEASGSKLSSARSLVLKQKPDKIIAFLGMGAPCAGMNSALKYSMQHLLTTNEHECRYRAVVIYDGFEGLMRAKIDDHPLNGSNSGNIQEWTISDLGGLHFQGGMKIGCKRTQPNDECAEKLKLLDISALVIIGGWDALVATEWLQKNAEKLPKGFKSVVIPATISSNLPLKEGLRNLTVMDLFMILS